MADGPTFAAGFEATALAIALVLALGLLIPLLLIGVNALLARSRPDARKLMPYEVGLTETVGSPRGRFAVKFYLVALLFVVFDVEAVFLYPWAANFRALGAAGFIEMLVFLGILLIGYAYIVKRGALEWE